MPTGLGAATTPAQSAIGLAWVPNADAIVGLTRDGFVFLLDRRTGAPLLPAPVQLPGERTPRRPMTIPATVLASAEALLQPLVNFAGTGGLATVIDVLLGGSSEVANNLSVDARTSRLWIAASAPDAQDGTVDGVSELGALYRYDVVRDGARWALEEVCQRNFTGGSASTPTLGANGTRVYLGDDVGALIAIDAETCGDAWEVPLDSQIFGSVAASSDGREIYAATADRHLPGVRRRRRRPARLDGGPRRLRHPRHADRLRRHEPAAHRRRRERPADPGGRGHHRRRALAAGAHRHRARRSRHRAPRAASPTGSRSRSAR